MRPLLLLAACAAAASAQTTRDVRCVDHDFHYQVYSPDARSALPAILLLHGAGGTSSDLLDVFLPLATREHVVLVAPQIPRETWFEDVAPAVFRCLVEDARRTAAIDPRRIYLFGYSMGGYLAFDGAMLASGYFAGAGVYGAAIADDYVSIVDRADRRIPIAIYIGTRDQFYPLDLVRRTRDLLTRRGFPVRYREFPGQDHGFAPVADQVVGDAWRFLAPFALPLSER